MPKPELSLIIPAYNEKERLEDSLPVIQDYLSHHYPNSEIILVDDGSRDGTALSAEKLLQDFPVSKVIRFNENKGKGAAVRAGMLAASGDICLFTDADLSTPMEETERALKALSEGYDIVIGSRAVKGTKLMKRQPRLREWMGKVFNRIALCFAFRGIRDSQCGFKAFKRSAASDLFSRARIDGFSFDVEILFLAQRAGYKILEMPVTWSHSPATRVRLLLDPIGMFLDVVKIRWMHRNR